jgi:L-threonylcarbamoyladenylate synthase
VGKNDQVVATILPTHTRTLFQEAVLRATELLRLGEVVALPTETVYGLAANALDASAVERIFQIKGRPAHNPIIVHVAEIEMAKQCLAQWPEIAGQLAKAFWPGPLTLVAKRAKALPDIVTAGGPTVGVRWPSHPFIQAVIRQCGFPLAAPSANLANQVSPTNAEHVRKSLGNRIPLIVDGGQSQIGIESTVLDVSVSPPRVLRPGMIHQEALLAVTSELAVGPGGDGGVIKSPGQLPKHYAPKARLVVLSWTDEGDLRRQVAAFELKISSLRPSKAASELPNSNTHVIAHTRIPSGEGFGRVSVIPHDAEAFARAIYAEMHRCDESGAELIVVESLPDTNEWFAIADRLKRAAAS